MAHSDTFCDCGVNRMNMLHSACSGRRLDGASFLRYGPAQLDRRSIGHFHMTTQSQTWHRSLRINTLLVFVARKIVTDLEDDICICTPSCGT